MKTLETCLKFKVPSIAALFKKNFDVLTSMYKLIQQDHYGRQCGTLLHSYCTGTYTEVSVLLLWGNSAVTMEYTHAATRRSTCVGTPR